MTSDTAARPPLDRARLGSAGGGARGADAGAPGRGWRVEVLERSPSTNAEAADSARAGAEEGLVVVAEHQTAGRGRLDRAWETPARSALTFSVVLRPRASVPAQRWPWLPLAAGVAVAETLRADGYAAGLKWPNDVLLRHGGDWRKVCGILVERVETADGPAAVVGIGLNTSLTAEELPIPTATSLAIERGGPVDRTEVLLALLDRLAGAYRLWWERPEELAQTYRSLSATLGEQVRAELPGGEVLSGTAVRIDEHGRLVVREASGAGGARERVVGAGDVVHARLQ